MLQTIIRRPTISADVEMGLRLAKAHNRDISPLDVTNVLNAAGIKHVLIGAHAINGYTGRPRTTVDVDVIVQHPKKASRAIAAAFPALTMLDTAVVIRFKDGEFEAIDLLKPNTSKLWPRLLKDGRLIKVGKGTLRVPTLEGVLAAKFSAMVSIARRMPDRQQDAVDFARAVEANEAIDLKLAEELGNLVFPGGGAELLQHVADARAGRPLTI